MFHHQMKHLEVRQKYSAARRIFNSLLSVSSGDETLRLMLDILLEKLFPICLLVLRVIILKSASNSLVSPEPLGCKGIIFSNHF